MKRRILSYAAIITVALALVAGLILVGAEPSRAADQPIVLKYQGKWVGNVHMAWANEQMKFADRVKAATGGKVVVQNMDEVKADNAVIDGIRSGVLDMGNQPIHSRGELVLPGFISMPFILWDRAPEMYEKLRPIFNDYWDKNFGVKYLGINYFLPNNLFTNKPCTTLEDIKKMKLRINGTLLVQMFKAAGGNPIVMNQAEIFTSAQRGVIDGAQTAVPGYLDGGLYEVCKYMSSWPLGVMAMAVTINKDSWNKLGPELQKQVVAAWLETEKAQLAGAKNDVGIAEAKAKSLGAIRQDPSKAEQDKLGSFAGPVVEDWKKKAGPDGAAVMKVVNEVMGTNF
jgi:TRAP-type C4-dicarboxylate transport system substrate-binding protein